MAARSLLCPMDTWRDERGDLPGGTCSDSNSLPLLAVNKNKRRSEQLIVMIMASIFWGLALTGGSTCKGKSLSTQYR
jgi:hypothetical protein